MFLSQKELHGDTGLGFQWPELFIFVVSDIHVYCTFAIEFR